MKLSRLAVLLVTAVLSCAALATPTFSDTRARFQPTEARLLARDGRVLHEMRVDNRARRMEWVALKDVSPAFIEALIASEDQRFFQHSGVDWTAAASAAWDNFTAASGKRPRGASTLTMQVAGLLRDDLAPRVEGRSLKQKWDQAGAARDLEKRWSKAEILEAYLNLVTFRGELQGIAAASRGLFGKHPAGLDRGEAMLLASLLRSPNAPAAQVAQRACVLRERLKVGPDCEAIRLEAASLKRAPQIRSEYSQAPHLARRLLEKPGQAVRTTLDLDVQRTAHSAMQRHLLELSGRNVEDAAVLVLDNASGEVLAWIGSSGALSRSGEIDGVTALRQAGSTLKPFLYGQAIEQRLITAASLIDDSPLNIETTIGVYTPGNYDGGYKGLTSARVALAGSLNVPAVKTLQRVGPEAFRQKLLTFGIDSLKESGDWYGYSLALGSADVSLAALTNAYRALANGGVWTPYKLQSATSSLRREALNPAAAFIVADMLSDNGARAITFDTDSVLATRPWTAVKTGTSKDMRDNWCIGFSSRYTVGVWVGNFSGAPMRDVSGVSGAAPIWAELMHALHATNRGPGDLGWTPKAVPKGFGDRPERDPNNIRSSRPEIPDGLVLQRISYEPAIEPPRAEWFMAGTEQANIRIREQAAVSTRIVYPTPGLIVAIDPDIPAAFQKLPIELSATSGVTTMKLGANELPLNRISYWSPERGRHTLALLDADGRTLSEVKFEVR